LSHQNVIGICPYCKFSINQSEDHTFCPGCEVPHHDECWHQNGGCTTFACTGEPVHHRTSNLDYTFDDLAEEYSGNKLVIEPEDLEDDKLDSVVSRGGSRSQYQGSTMNGSYLSGAVKDFVWGGLISSFIIWLIASNYFNLEYYASHQRFSMALFDLMAFAMVIGGAAGSCFGAIEGIAGKVPIKTLNGVIAGLIFGILGAVVGTSVGQQVYFVLGGEQIDHIPTLVLIRGFFWAFVGLFIGLAQGLSAGGGERVKNGLIGGIIGGFLGGAIFDAVFLTFQAPDLSAFVAIFMFNICIGLSIGFVQEHRKEAWLKVYRGATAGKEYIIQGNITKIGSKPNCDIVLVNDSQVGQHHADIRVENNKYIIYARMGYGVWVNNRELRRGQIKHGDEIRIGSIIMGFFEKTNQGIRTN